MTHQYGFAYASSSSPSIESFQKFTSTVYDPETPEYELFNGYTTFMMCKVENRENIKEHRMNWVVNNFTNYYTGDNSEFYNIYKQTVNDTYPGVFSPPPCVYNEIMREEDKQRQDEAKEAEEWYNDDIQTHYRDIANKYARSIENPNKMEYTEYEYESEYNDVEESSFESDYNTSIDDVEYYTEDYEDLEYEDQQYECDYNDW